MSIESGFTCRSACLLVLLCGGWLLADAAAAQYTFGRRGSGANQNMISAEEIRERAADSVWTLGGLRLQPVAGLDDIAYVRDQTASGLDGVETNGGQDDFTATVTAGLRAYAGGGPKLMFAAHVLPEYVWWQDNDARGGFGGRGGVGAFGDFNRLRFELSHRIERQQRFFSTEVQALTQQQTQTTRARGEIRVARRMWAYGGTELRTLEGDEDAADLFSRLDRDTDSWDVGVRLESPRGFEVWLGVGARDIDFADGARNLSNKEDRVLGGISYDRDRVGVWLSGEQRDSQPDPDSLAPESSTTTGNLELLWRATPRLDTMVFARSDRTYSLLDTAAFIDTRYVGVGTEWSPAASRLRLWTSAGEDDYDAIEGSSIGRTDDFLELGAGFDTSIGRLLIVGLDIYYRDYDSSDDAFDRDVTNLGVRIQLGAIGERLRLGGNSALW